MRTLQHSDKAPVASVQFAPSSLQLLASSLDSAVRLWDMANARVLKTYTGHVNTKSAGRAVFLCRRAHNGALRVWVACGSEDRRVYIWDLQTRRIVQTLNHFRDAVVGLSVRNCTYAYAQPHPTLPLLAAAALGQDASTQVWLDIVT